MRQTVIHLFGAVLVLLSGARPTTLSACTLWGAAGEAAAGGTIISKNRDWKPDHVQVLKMSRNESGYSYFGLYAEGNDAPGLKQGVNEKGLSVTTATAGSIPKKTREAQPGKSGLMTTLLTHYANCDDVLRDKEKLFANRRPSFLMVSDRNKILMVEIGVKGKYSIKTVESGTVAHSNHYLQQDLQDCNFAIGTSSAKRVARVSDLLNATPKPFNLASFAKISQDGQNGPNESLWRTGTQGSRTLSSWILESPPSSPPKLRVLIANPKQPEKVCQYVLDEKFWRGTPDSLK